MGIWSSWSRIICDLARSQSLLNLLHLGKRERSDLLLYNNNDFSGKNYISYINRTVINRGNDQNDTMEFIVLF